MEMEEMEITVTINDIHKAMPLFNAAKVADKRITDLISDCVKLKLTRYLPDLRLLKEDIMEIYAEAAGEELDRIGKEVASA